MQHQNKYDIIPNPFLNDKKEAEPPPKCEHDFELYKNIIREYSEDLCEKIIQHGKSGFFIEGFAGKHNVCINSMVEWIESNDELYKNFKSAVNISISASLHYWNHELTHAIEHRDTDMIATLRGIVSDIMKSTPKILRNKQFEGLETPEERGIRLAREAEEERIKSSKDFMSAATGGHVINV